MSKRVFKTELDAVNNSLQSQVNNSISKTIVDAKGDIVTASAADTPIRLAVGTNEHRLVADSATTSGLKYVADTTNYAVGAKGDLLVGTAADTVAALTVGANNTVLTADSTTATGLKWAAPLPSQSGNSGKYLTTDGSTASWGTVSAGGMTLLTTQSLTSGSQITISSISADYNDLYLVVYDLAPNNGNSYLLVRVNNISSSTYRKYDAFAPSGLSQNTFTEFRPLGANNHGGLTDTYFSMTIQQYANTDSPKLVYYQGFVDDTPGGTLQGCFGVGVCTATGANTTAINRIDLIWSGSTTFSRGTLKLYGVK